MFPIFMYYHTFGLICTLYVRLCNFVLHFSLSWHLIEIICVFPIMLLLHENKRLTIHFSSTVNFAKSISQFQNISVRYSSIYYTLKNHYCTLWLFRPFSKPDFLLLPFCDKEVVKNALSAFYCIEKLRNKRSNLFQSKKRTSTQPYYVLISVWQS